MSEKANDDSLDAYLERGRREMFPLVKSSEIGAMIMGEPDPKLCLELGAMILFDKPLLLLVPPGRTVPLSLRTIATRIVEDFDGSEASQKRMQQAMGEMLEAARFRGKPTYGKPALGPTVENP